MSMLANVMKDFRQVLNIVLAKHCHIKLEIDTADVDQLNFLTYIDTLEPH